MIFPAKSLMSGKSVMFLINRDEGGGVEYLGRVLSADLESRGAVCSTGYIYSSNSYNAISKFTCILRKAISIASNAPDILITFQPTASAIASVAGRLGGCRVRIVHQSNSPAKSHAVVREIDRVLGSSGGYTVTIANSRATFAEFAEYPSSYRSKIKLIEHGIPPPQHVLSPDEVRAKFGLPDYGPLLLMAARLDLQKGHAIVVSALAQLPSTVRLVMAGSGPERDNLISLAKRIGVADRLHFLGHVGRQDLTDLYRASSLMVFPSSWETFGLAAVEAAMAGLPVLSSDIPALHEVLTCDGRTTARFVKSRQASDWAIAIRAALTDPDLRPQSEDFAALIQNQYSEERMMAAYVQLYSELLS